MQLNLKKIPKSRNKVNKFPQTPGIYVFWEKATPIYIGKAINLKKRVISYFSNSLIGKTKIMVETSNQISYLRVNSELEAILLETKLVNKYKPKFNIELKDDKNPLYIRISKEEYPRILIARKNDNKSKNMAFFGPFPSSKKVKEVLPMTLSLKNNSEISFIDEIKKEDLAFEKEQKITKKGVEITVRRKK